MGRENRWIINSFEVGPFQFARVTEGAETSHIRERLTWYWQHECIGGRGEIKRLYLAHWLPDHRNPPQAEIAMVSLQGHPDGVAYYWCSEDPERIYQYPDLATAAIKLDRAHGYGWDTCYGSWVRRVKEWHLHHGGMPPADLITPENARRLLA